MGDGSSARRVKVHQALALLLAILCALALVPFGLRPEQVSDLATAAIFAMIAVLAVAALVLGRKTPRQRIRLAWIAAIVWSLFMLAPLALKPYFDQERRQSEREAIKTIVDGARKGTPISPASVDNRSIMGQIVPVHQKYEAEFLRLAKEFEAFETTIDMESVIKPSALATDSGRAKNLDTIARYTEALQRQRKQELETHARYRDEVAAVVSKASNAQEIMVAVDAAQARRKAVEGESLANHLELMRSMRSLNDYVAARRASVVFRDGSLILATDADVEGYKRIFAEIRRIAAAEEELDRRRAEIARAGLERLDKEASK